MTLRFRYGVLVSLMALVAIGGCSVQDSDQPAVGSISIKAREEDAPIKTSVKRARTPRSH